MEGIEGMVPALLTHKKPTLLPNSRHSSKERPSSNLQAKAPVKQSPAPAVSTSYNPG